MKSYTDIEQSKKLAEILPIESADMSWAGTGLGKPFARTIPCKDYPEEICPCWSLAALLEILPDEIIDDNGYNILINIEKYDLKYRVSYFTDLNWADKITTDEYESFVDACYEMILKLHKLNLL